MLLTAALLIPLIRKRLLRESVLRAGMLFLSFALGAACQVREENIWQQETKQLFANPRITVSGTLIRKEQKTNSWQLTIAPAGYKNHVIVSAPSGDFPLDALLTVEGSVKHFELPTNEGQFNQRQYYKCKNVLGIFYDATISCAKKPSGIASWREGLYIIRSRMCRVYEDTLEERSAGMLSAMITGIKSGMDEEVKRNFQVAGFSHILAISGMHISLIGMGIYRLLRRYGRSYGCCVIIGAGTLLAYGEMIGWGISTRRAIAMFLVYLLAQFLGKGYDLWSSLSFAAVLLLADCPFLTMDAGARLSFTAVMAVAATESVRVKIKQSEDEEKSHRSFPGSQSLFLAVVLQLFTLPLVAYSYYELPVYALFLNFLLLPYAGIIVGCGLVGGLLGLLSPQLAAVVLLPSRLVAAVYLWACEFVNGLSHATIICGQPVIWQLICYYILLYAAFWLLGRKERLLRHRFVWLGATSGLLLALLIAPGQLLQEFSIDYLDVGQGDGACIRTTEGSVCFVDGGSSDVSGVGTYRILPFLKANAISAVDVWIISHADEDHISGFFEVVEAGYTVKRIVVSNCMPDSAGRRKLCDTARLYGIPITSVSAGEVLYFNREKGDARLTFLAPKTVQEDANESSLVFYYEDGSMRAFFGGDIGVKQEVELLNQGLVRPVDLYKASHHGSRYSNSETFLEELSPRLSVISCGRYNRYGHPAKEALLNIEASGSQICVTMYDGQIKIRRGRGGWYVSTQK